MCVPVIDFLLIIFSFSTFLKKNILEKITLFPYELENTKEWTWSEHLQINLTHSSFTPGLHHLRVFIKKKIKRFFFSPINCTVEFVITSGGVSWGNGQSPISQRILRNTVKKEPGSHGLHQKALPTFDPIGIWIWTWILLTHSFVWNYIQVRWCPVQPRPYMTTLTKLPAAPF